MLLEEPRTTPSTARRTERRVSLPAAIAAGSLVLAALSLLFPSAPTYDPWAWIIWGREITELDLNTVDGPSWKPLPVLFTTVFAVFGEDAAPQLWVMIGRAGAIAGTALAFLVARRLAGPVAGAAAAAGLGLAPWWVRNAALANSEGLMVTCVLGAVLAHVHGRRGWAFALAINASLLRPEAWPFTALYGLWLLLDDRRRLPWLAGGFATLPVLWLGPELWGSGNAFRASDRAQNPRSNSPAFSDDPAGEVISNAIGMLPIIAVVGVVAAVVIGVARRARDTEAKLALFLAALGASWIGLVAVMTIRGFSGNQRYLIAPGALLIVAGAAGIVWALQLAIRRRTGPRLAVAAAMAAAAVAFAAQDGGELGPTLEQSEYQADLAHDLDRVVEEAGGAKRLRGCGNAYTGPFLVPAVAWELRLHAEQVDLEPRRPDVTFHVRTLRGSRLVPRVRGGRMLAREGGWVVTANCRTR